MFPNSHRTWSLAALIGAACTMALPAQNLRHGIWNADLVVVAQLQGVRPLGNDAFLHTLKPLRTLKGDPVAQMTIVEDKRISDQPKPVAGKPRIYCLKFATNVDAPSRFAPYFRMAGFLGDHPLVSEDPEKPNTAEKLTALLIASEQGASPADTCRAIVDLALTGEGAAATEAAQVLRERAVLRGKLDALQKSDLLSRAVGEMKDQQRRIALASLCAELRMRGVIDALCMSLESAPDRDFARCLGRLSKFLHGEEALEILRPHITRARKEAAREHLMLALGATETERALDALLQHKRVHGQSAALDAALRAHGTPRAMAAIEKKPASKPTADRKDSK